MPDVSQFFHFIKRLTGTLAPGTLLLALFYLRIQEFSGVTASPPFVAGAAPARILRTYAPSWGWLSFPIWDWLVFAGLAVLAYFLGNALTNVALWTIKFINWVCSCLWGVLRDRTWLGRWAWFRQVMFDLETEERIDTRLGTRTLVPDPDFSRVLPRGRVKWLAARMYVVRHSPRLGTDLLELEGEINVHAGLIIPVVLLWFHAKNQVGPEFQVGVAILLTYLVLRTIGLMQREALALYSACIVVAGKVLPQSSGVGASTRFE